MVQPENKRGTLGSVMKGMMLLGVGDKEGLNCFSNSIDGFLASLAPQLACIVVGSVQIFFSPQHAIILTKLLLALCVLLLPAIVSQFFAQMWKKNDLWLRYITAATWSSWVVVILSMFCTVATMSFAPDFVQQPLFLELVAVGSALYECWIQWFIAKHGLAVSSLKAALLYLTTIVSILLLYFVVAHFPPHYQVLNDIIQPIKEAKPH